MVQALRIAIADDESLMRRWYEKTLPALGHQVVVSASDGAELVAGCRAQKPDLVISDIAMPGGDGLAAAAQLRDELPMILVSAHHDQQFIDQAVEHHVLAYLIKPVKQADLQTAIALVTRRFAEFRALEHQAENLQQALADRKLIERAKGILMTRAGLAEQEAFTRLQKLSQARNQKLVEVARTLVEAEDAFADL